MADAGVAAVNDAIKGQLDLERQGGRTETGVIVRVLQRILASDRFHLAQRADRPTTCGPSSPTTTNQATPWN